MFEIFQYQIACVKKKFSKIPNIKFYDQLFVGPGVFYAYTLAAGRMK
jgi:hypothetical protein